MINRIPCPLRYKAWPGNEPVNRHVLGAEQEAVAQEEEKTRRPGVMVGLIRPFESSPSMMFWGKTEHEAVEEMMSSIASILITHPEARENWPQTSAPPRFEIETSDVPRN